MELKQRDKMYFQILLCSNKTSNKKPFTHEPEPESDKEVNTDITFEELTQAIEHMRID